MLLRKNGLNASSAAQETTRNTTVCAQMPTPNRLTKKAAAAPTQNQMQTNAGAAASTTPNATAMPSQMIVATTAAFPS